MRQGIFGGTFNPIHTGHLILAQDVLEALKLDGVLFIPTATPPHKKADSLASAEHRLGMIRAAIKGRPQFEASDIEILRGGKSYSVETLRTLGEAHPKTRWFFIVGVDSFLELHTWREIDALARMCEFVVVARPRFDLEELTAVRKLFRPDTFKRVSRHILRSRHIEISSTEIRKRVKIGKPIRHLVPDEVEDYIKEHSLYRKKK